MIRAGSESDYGWSYRVVGRDEPFSGNSLPSIMNARTFLTHIVAMLAGLALSCKEPLPAYRDPTEVLSGVLRIGYLSATYPGTNLSVQLVTFNDFDETFEGRTLFEGTVEIVLARKPEVKKTFFLSAGNLIQGKYNAGSRVLTLNPRDSVRLGVTWEFVDDRGTDLIETEFHYFADPTCKGRFIAREETFIVSGKIKLYERIAEIKFGPLVFPLCHVKNPRPLGCVTLWGEEACRLIR